MLPANQFNEHQLICHFTFKFFSPRKKGKKTHSADGKGANDLLISTFSDHFGDYFIIKWIDKVGKLIAGFITIVEKVFEAEMASMTSTVGTTDQKEKARMALLGNRFGTPKLRELLREVGSSVFSQFHIFQFTEASVFYSVNSVEMPHPCPRVASTSLWR